MAICKTARNVNFGIPTARQLLAIKIMMSAEVVEKAAASLLSRAVLLDVIETSVKSHSDKHYFAVALHRGISARVPHRNVESIAKLLSCSNRTVHGFMAEHMVGGLSRAGCGYCHQASRLLKRKIKTEQIRGRRANPLEYPGYLLIY